MIWRTTRRNRRRRSPGARSRQRHRLGDVALLLTLDEQDARRPVEPFEAIERDALWRRIWAPLAAPRLARRMAPRPWVKPLLLALAVAQPIVVEQRTPIAVAVAVPHPEP